MNWRDRMDVVAMRLAARSASFDEPLFRRVVARHTSHLEVAVDGDEDVVDAWIRLVAEGVATGLVGEGEHLLDVLLRSVVPEQLGAASPEERLHQLALVWNLGEGASEHVWVDRFLARQMTPDVELDSLAEWCEDALSSVYEEPAQAAWRGPFQVRWVDLSTVSPRFLPGALSLVAPAWVQVRDRRTDEAVMLHLAPGGDHEILGVGPVVGGMAWTASPPVDVRPHQVTVARQPISLPTLSAPRAALAAPVGVVVVTAEDSQRVWLLSE